MNKKDKFEELKKSGEKFTITIQEQAEKLIKDYDYFKNNKDFLAPLTIALIDCAQYLNEYNIMLEKHIKQKTEKIAKLNEDIYKLNKESRNKQDTIEQLKNNNIKENSDVFIMNKQIFNKTKLNNEHDVMKKLNDLLTENRQLKDKLRIAQRDNDGSDREIKYYKDNYIRLYHERMYLLGLIERMNNIITKLKKENK